MVYSIKKKGSRVELNVLFEFEDGKETFGSNKRQAVAVQLSTVDRQLWT